MKENAAKKRPGESDEEVALRRAAENLGNLTNGTDITKPEIFFINRKALRDIKANLDYGLNHLQAIIDEYFKIVGEFPTMEEVESWFGNGGRDFLLLKRDILTDNITTKLCQKQKKDNPGRKISPDDLDLDLDKLFEVSGQLIFIPDVNFRDTMLWTAYTITKGKVELIQEEAEPFKNRFRVYAETTLEKERLAKIQELCAVLGTIKLDHPTKLNIPDFVSWDAEAGMYVPSENYIKGYLR
jgi:hypothetical protein